MNKVKTKIGDALVQVIAVMIGLILIFPIVYCVCSAFKTLGEFALSKLLPESFTYLANFKNALHQAPLMRYMLNSVIVSLLGTVMRLVFSILAAYAFTNYEFKFKNACFFLILATMMMPGDILLVTNYATVSKLGLLNSYLGMCITSFVSASQMFMLRQRFMSVPRDMRDAAMLYSYGTAAHMQARNNHAFYTELYHAVEFLPVASDRYGQQPRDAYHYGRHNQAEFMGGYQL